MWRFAFRNLLTRPMRSLLSLLGLTVAIVGMVGLFSVADGIDEMVHKTFKAVPGLAVLQPGAPIPIFSRLPKPWGEEIARIEGVHEINIEIWARAHIIDDQPVFNPPRFLFGTDIPSRLRMYYAVYREHMIEGRFLAEQDIGTYRAVISKPIAEEFDVKVGESLNVDGQDLEIVGIYSCGTLLLDVAIILDIGVVKKLARMDGDFISAIYVEPEPDVDRQELGQRIRDQFKGREVPAGSPLEVLQGLAALSNLTTSVSPTKPKASSVEKTANPSGRQRRPHQKKEKSDSSVEVRSADDWAEEFKNFSADLDLFLIALTSIGVTIAVLSIVNTMLMSVTERFIEFGILKANGWTNRNILLLITYESALLGILGGLLGASLGWVATGIVNANWPDQIHLYAGPRLLVFSVLFSTVLGTLGGLYPAIWASRMMPMDAIRRG